MSQLYSDYEIDINTLTSNAKIPSLAFLVLISILSISVNIIMIFAIGYFTNIFNNNIILIIVSIAGGFIIFLTGIIGGNSWLRVGYKMASATYMPYVSEKYNILSKLYIKFAESDSRIFLEAKAKDPRFTGIRGIIFLIIRISLSQLGFYITITSLLINPLRPYFVNHLSFYNKYGSLIDPIIALAFSIILLGLYLPMSFILDDANLRTFNTDERKIYTPSRGIRGKIDGIVGFSALTTGWGIFETVRISNSGYFFIKGDSTFSQALDYVSWLAFIMALSWPIILPAAIYFFQSYDKLINKFRTDAIVRGIPIGVSKIRPPDGMELSTLQVFIKNNINILPDIDK